MRLGGFVLVGPRSPRCRRHARLHVTDPPSVSTSLSVSVEGCKSLAPVAGVGIDNDAYAWFGSETVEPSARVRGAASAPIAHLRATIQGAVESASRGLDESPIDGPSVVASTSIRLRTRSRYSAGAVENSLERSIGGEQVNTGRLSTTALRSRSVTMATGRAVPPADRRLCRSSAPEHDALLHRRLGGLEALTDTDRTVVLPADQPVPGSTNSGDLLGARTRIITQKGEAPSRLK